MNAADGSLDVEEIGENAHVWVFTSAGGSCYQGPKQYKRRADARRAGQQWLAETLGQQR